MLGIGVRVATRVVKERVDAHAQSSQEAAAKQQAAPPSATPAQPAAPAQPLAPAVQPAAPPPPPSRVETASREAAEKVRQSAETATRTVRQQAPVVVAQARGVGEGAKRFGKAIWGPFAHVSSVLWSEVTGVFFGLFAFYFARGIFVYRAQYKAGPDHEKFVLDVAMTLVFGYFALSSFYIARRKEKKRRS
ncbi:MAG TPA: hypothetical protein VM554_14505 [Acidisarcina sp.]|nr:hypothetical protein [Acidisarcina sp.]